MNCPNCGKQNSDDAPLCSSCGWVLCWKPATKKTKRVVSMNRKQMIVILVGIAFLVLMGLFPPRRRVIVSRIHRMPESPTPDSNYWTWDGIGYVMTSSRINIVRLAVQWALVAAITGGLIIVLRDKNTQQDEMESRGEASESG